MEMTQMAINKTNTKMLIYSHNGTLYSNEKEEIKHYTPTWMKLTDVDIRRLISESTFYFYKVQDQEKLIEEESRSVGIENRTVVIFLRILMTVCTQSLLGC